MCASSVSWNRDLATRFAAGFDPVAPSPRTIGREAEFPVVDADGWAGDVQALLRRAAEQNPSLQLKYEGDLLVEVKAERFILAAEVGIGTVELITGPRPNLSSLEADHLMGLECLNQAAEPEDLRLLGLGIQPRSKASPDLMCSKERYRVLLQTMGPAWLWFTLTASDQVHIDVGLDELASATNCTSLLTAATVALCGNSGIFHDVDSGVCSAREHLMGQIHAGDHRHGMPAGPIRDIEDLIGQMAAHRHLMQKQRGQPLPSFGPFSEHLEQLGGPGASGAFEAFLFHEHYIWNSSRPRSAQGTLELRSACQQPGESHMAATSLGLAMVEAHRDLSVLLDEALGDDSWPSARAWHAAVIQQGLEAEEPSPRLLQRVLEICRGALDARGMDEARYLDPLFMRLETRKNPAQRSRALLETGGMEALLDQTSLP